MNGMMQPGPTLYEAERLRKERGSRGLLGAVGEPMSYAPNPLVSIIGSGLLSAQYLTGDCVYDPCAGIWVAGESLWPNKGRDRLSRYEGDEKLDGRPQMDEKI
jgi:hypothetical protein